nr:MAG TPA: hypothetical protein [Caudoviricetes sp.]
MENLSIILYPKRPSILAYPIYILDDFVLYL